MQSSDVFEAAARATINERCAAAFLHDIRGSMQAVFSAFELLGRSARMGGGDAARVERVCDLAKRAITQHEKSTMEILQLLTLQPSDVVTLELQSLLREAVHFLRNDASAKGVVLQVAAETAAYVSVARAKLQTMLVGLLASAIDYTAPATNLLIEVRVAGAEAAVVIPAAGESELTLKFAQHLMSSSGGRLQLEPCSGPHPRLILYFPLAAPSDSLAAARVSSIEK